MYAGLFYPVIIPNNILTVSRGTLNEDGSAQFKLVQYCTKDNLVVQFYVLAQSC